MFEYFFLQTPLLSFIAAAPRRTNFEKFNLLCQFRDVKDRKAANEPFRSFTIVNVQFLSSLWLCFSRYFFKYVIAIADVTFIPHGNVIQITICYLSFYRFLSIKCFEFVSLRFLPCVMKSPDDGTSIRRLLDLIFRTEDTWNVCLWEL